MRRFILNCIIFFSCLLSFPIGVSISNDVILPCNETESSLAIIPNNKHYRYIFLGSSEARMLTRNQNYWVTNSILGKDNYLNMAQGSGGGALPSYLSLTEFFIKKNTADTLFYFITPYVFYYNEVNINHPFFYREPFKISSLLNMIKERIPASSVYTYLLGIKKINWKEDCKWKEAKSVFGVLDIKDSTSLARKNISITKMENWIKKGGDAFQIYSSIFFKTKELCKKNNTELFFVFAPNFNLKEVPGQEELKKYFFQNNLKLLDLSDSIINPNCFMDYFHLNYWGVTEFIPKLIKKSENSISN